MLMLTWQYVTWAARWHSAATGVNKKLSVDDLEACLDTILADGARHRVRQHIPSYQTTPVAPFAFINAKKWVFGFFNVINRNRNEVFP